MVPAFQDAVKYVVHPPAVSVNAGGGSSRRSPGLMYLYQSFVDLPKPERVSRSNGGLFKF